MNTSELRHVRQTRKRHSCDWCGEAIDKGTACKTWFCFGEAVSVRMHPECLAAMHKTWTDEELPEPGEFGRGCWCGEPDYCECTGSQALKE